MSDSKHATPRGHHHSKSLSSDDNNIPFHHHRNHTDINQLSTENSIDLLNTTNNTQILPNWMPNSSSKHCLICGSKFSLIFQHQKRHHCRKCGRLICDNCSKTRIKLADNLYNGEAVRICDDCQVSYRQKKAISTAAQRRESLKLEIKNASSMVSKESHLIRIYTLDGSFKTIYFDKNTTALNIIEKIMGSSNLVIALFEVEYDLDDNDSYKLIPNHILIQTIFEKWEQNNIKTGKIVVPVNHPVSDTSLIKNIPHLIGTGEIGRRKSLLARKTDENINNNTFNSNLNETHNENDLFLIENLKQQLKEKENGYKMLKNVIRKRSKSILQTELFTDSDRVDSNDTQSSKYDSQKSDDYLSDRTDDDNNDNNDINDNNNNNNDNDNNINNIFLGKKIIKKGYLKKSGRLSKKLRKRYFVLGGDLILRYAKDENLAEKNEWKGEVWLDRIIKITRSSEKLGIILVLPERTILLVAQNRNDLLEWQKILLDNHSRRTGIEERGSTIKRSDSLSIELLKSLHENKKKENIIDSKDVRDVIGRMIETEEFFIDIDEKIEKVLGNQRDISNDNKDNNNNNDNNDNNNHEIFSRQSSTDSYFEDDEERETVVKMLSFNSDDSDDDDDDDDDDELNKSIITKDILDNNNDNMRNRMPSTDPNEKIKHRSILLLKSKEKKVQLTPEIILHIQDIIGSMTDLYGYILHLGEEWSLNLHKWLLENLKIYMTLPVERPDILMAILQALKNENLLHSSETTATIQEVIEISFSTAKINERFGYELKYPENWDENKKTFFDDENYLDYPNTNNNIINNSNNSSTKKKFLKRLSLRKTHNNNTTPNTPNNLDPQKLVRLDEDGNEITDKSEEKRKREEADEDLKNVLELVKRMVYTLHLVVDEIIPLLPLDFNILQLFQEKAEQIISGNLKNFLSKYRNSIAISHVLTLLTWAEDHNAIMKRFGISKFSEEFQKIKLFLLERYKSQVKDMIGLWIKRIIEMNKIDDISKITENKVTPWPEDLDECLKQQLAIASNELQGDSSLIIGIISLSSLNTFINNHLNVNDLTSINTPLEIICTHINDYDRFTKLIERQKIFCDNMEKTIGDQIESQIMLLHDSFYDKTIELLDICIRHILYDIRKHLNNSLFKREWENSTYAMETTNVTMEDYANDCKLWIRNKIYYSKIIRTCLKEIVTIYINQLFNSKIRINEKIKTRLNEDFSILKNSFSIYEPHLPIDLRNSIIEPIKKCITLLTCDPDLIVGLIENDIYPLFGNQKLSNLLDIALLMRGDDTSIIMVIRQNINDLQFSNIQPTIKLDIIDASNQLSRRHMSYK